MRTAAAFALVGLLAAPAQGRGDRPAPAPWRPPVAARTDRSAARLNEIFWYDDMESGEGQWTHGDFGEDRIPHFHVDAFLAYPDSTPPSWSWWCGTFDWDDAGELPGGYGNGWVDYLELPPVDAGFTVVERTSWGAIKGQYRKAVLHDRDTPRSPQPVLSFSYRYDLEPGYDFAWAQVDSSGVWTNLSPGFTGSSGGWHDFGESGFLLIGYGDPLGIRFMVASDHWLSDEDGYYDSDGGAFHVDNIRVFDAITGEVFFFEDCEDGGAVQCTPAATPPAGDLWHIQDRPCKASSGTHSWWCGDDADTAHLPPGLENYLMSPLVDVTGVQTCTLRWSFTTACPTLGTTWRELVTLDGGLSFYQVGHHWGDQADYGFGPCHLSSASVSCIPDLAWDGTSCGIMFLMETDPLGGPHGPGGNGDIGITIDDVVMYGWGVP